MTLDELEFAISQYLDGSLSAEEAAALESRIDGDEAARLLLEEYKRVELAAKLHAAPLPPELEAVKWDKLAAHLSKAVDEDAEFVELTVSQYADGTLPPEDVADVEDRLADDPRARQLLVQERTLTASLRSMPLPDVRWDRLAAHLSRACHESDGQVLRINWDDDDTAAEPRTFKLSAYRWMRAAGAVAAAACVAVVTWVGMHHGGRQGEIKVDGPTQVASGGPKVTEIQIGVGGADVAPEPSTGSSAVAQVTVDVSGPEAGTSSPAYADADGIVVTRPSRSLIATRAPSADDVVMPY